MRRPIVPEFITLDGVIQAPGGKDGDTDAMLRWKTSHKPLVEWNNRGNSGLLEHDFGNQDCVRVASPSPRQIALILPIPGD
jgi:hypothetical protein